MGSGAGPSKRARGGEAKSTAAEARLRRIRPRSHGRLLRMLRLGRGHDSGIAFSSFLLRRTGDPGMGVRVVRHGRAPVPGRIPGRDPPRAPTRADRGETPAPVLGRAGWHRTEDLADPPHALGNRLARRRVRDADVALARLAERAARRHGDGGFLEDPLAQGLAVEAYIDLREDVERAGRSIRRESVNLRELLHDEVPPRAELRDHRL